MKTFVTLSFLFVFSSIIAQTPLIDSLLEVEKTASDKQKVEVLSKLSYNFSKIENKIGLTYAEQALEIADKQNYSELKSEIYNNLALNYFYQSNIEQVFYYADLAKKDAEKNSNSIELATSCKLMGCACQITSDFDSALMYFETEKNILIKENEKLKLALCYTNIGTIYSLRAESNIAIENFMLAESLYIELKETKKLYDIYARIGETYLDNNNFVETEKYFKLGITGCLEINNYSDLARLYNDMGLLYKKQKQYNKAIKNFEIGLSYLEKQPNKYVLMIIYGNMGNTYSLMENYSQSETYIKKSLEIAIELNSKKNIASTYHNLGDNYKKMGKYYDAIIYLLKGNELLLELKNYNNLLQSYQALFETYDAMEKYENSIKYYKLYIYLNDSLVDANKLNSIDSLQTLFNTKFVKDENIILHQETEINKKTISNQRLTILFVISVLLLLVGLAVIIILNRRKLKLYNTNLLQKNDEITQQTEELKILNDKLVELDGFKAGMMQMIVHDLKNPLNILQNIQYYNSYNEQLDVVKQTSNLMMNLVQDILDVNKYENTKMNLEIVNLSILHLVDIAHKDVLYLLENKNIIIEKKIQNNIGVKSDKNILVRVITNLLTNAIKYAPQNSIITIEANESIENKDFVEILIADQGKGIPQEYLEKIFDKFIQINKKDEKVRSTGLGLTFCKLAIESHNGTIKAESKESTGAKFIFTVPKTTEYEVYNDLKFESEKTAFNFNNEEISYLKNYIEQLKNSAVYKISNINTILKMIKENSNSSNIILWCDNLYKTAISGNQKKYKEILNI